jgi:hypothetical protein
LVKLLSKQCVANVCGLLQKHTGSIVTCFVDVDGVK